MRARQLSHPQRGIWAGKGESGQALVETAITLFLFVLMLLGSAEIGRIAYASVQVVSAAKAAVQYGDRTAADSLDTQGIINAAAAEAPLLPNMSTVSSVSCLCADSISCTSTGGATCAGSIQVYTLTVNTSASFNPLIHLPGLPATFTLHGYAIQKVLSNGF